MDEKQWMLPLAAIAIAVVGAAVIRCGMPTSGELASWVQAVASVAAIWWAGRVGVRLQVRQRVEERRTLAEAVHRIAFAAQSLARHVTEQQLTDRQAVHDFAERRREFDFVALQQIERTIEAIPLHELTTPELVTEVIILSATFRQFRSVVEQALKIHAQMDANDFTRLFSTFREVNQGLARSSGSIGEEAAKIR